MSREAVGHAVSAASAERDLGLYLEGLARFDAGDHHGSHEVLEDLWLRCRSEARPFFQGLIQLAAAHWHLARGRNTPALALFTAATAKLRPFTPTMLGLDVAHLLLETEAHRIHAGSLGPHRHAPIDPHRMDRLRIIAPTLDEFWPHRGVVPHPLEKPSLILRP